MHAGLPELHCSDSFRFGSSKSNHKEYPLAPTKDLQGKALIAGEPCARGEEMVRSVDVRVLHPVLRMVPDSSRSEHCRVNGRRGVSTSEEGVV
jgi:hypothetical protein